MTTGRLRAGVAELEITGEVGAQLAAELNPRASRGARTPLMARALVLSDGDETLALVTLDVYGLGAGAIEGIVSRIGERCGIGPGAVMLVSSHTRAAPYATPVVGWPGVDEAFVAGLVAEVPEVVAQAKDALQDAALGVGQARFPHLVYNHRMLTRNFKAISAWMDVPKDEVLEPEGPVDPTFSVFVVRDERGRPICLLWNFAADNRFSQDDQISADLPYFVQQALDERLGRHVPCLYLPGCGGDVSFTYGLDQTADAVASGVMAVQLETPCDPAVKLGCASERMILPIRDTSQFWSQADIELKAPDAVEAFRQEVALMQEEGAHAVPATVQAFRLGRFAIAGLPGMPFVAFALQVVQDSPFSVTVAVGNVGGDVGYLIPRDAFAHEGFEAWPARSAKVGPGGGEFVVGRAVRMLDALFKA